jgi:two-component system OmpR family sensor kinase
MRGRRSLAFRIGLLTAVVSVLTGVIAGLLGVNLIRRADTEGAQQTLGRVATELATSAGAVGSTRVRIGLRALRVSVAEIGTNGVASGPNPLSRDALDATQVRRVLAGHAVSTRERVDGISVLVAARPTPAGGIVLAQRRSDALSVSNAEVRRLLFALLVAVLVAILLGVLVARRVARPLRRTAAAAHALAAGTRGVEVASDGPAEVAEVADAVNTLAAHLGASEARQREFLLSVSHDLRTPLTAITGYAESMADGLVPAERVPEIGRVLGGEAQRLSRLVGDLLDLARLEAQDVRIEVIDVDLDTLLHATGEVWYQRCTRAGVAFSVEQAAPGARLLTDPTRLRQVLDGLLENALRVTPAGRPIVLAAHRAPDLVVIEIRDGGPGLTDDDLRVAFDRSALYERYRGVRQVGTGLGLAIVHRLVERLGGSVEAGHAAEGGARFAVALPSR